MTEYFVPSAPGCAEFVEKRSRFIGQVWPVETEEQAREYIAQTKATHYDARHNCWCYLLREGGVLRYSDDGEPQGTAGQPMLEVFRREGVENVCCVVTRYFGGILLGAGGLLRAYTRSAKEALDAAGISVVRRWILVGVNCPYPLFDRMKLDVELLGGILDQVDYGADVRLHILLPEEQGAAFTMRVTELTAGGAMPEPLGERFRGSPCR